MTRTQAILNNPSWKTIPILVNEGGEGKTYRTIHRLTCHRCLRHVEINGPGNLPWEVITKKFRDRGWTVDPIRPGRCFCPDHTRAFNPVLDPVILNSKQERTAMAATKETATVEPLQPKPAPEKSAPEKEETVTGYNPPKPAQMRRLYGLLEEHFDAAAGQYRNGYSDRRVASEAQVGLSAVVSVREEAYGKLKDTALDLAIAKITKLETEWTSLGEMIFAAKHKLLQRREDRNG